MTNQLSTTTQVMGPFLRPLRKVASLIAAERADELWDEIFLQKRWELSDAPGAGMFFAQPTEHRVTVTYAGLACVWLLAYVAYHTLDAGLRAQNAARTRARHTQSDIDIGRVWRDLRLTDHLNYARHLLHNDEPWPERLARPDPGATFNSVEGRINNAFLGAVAWIVLHEIGHVHHRDSALIPAAHRLRQEYAADDFATRWVFQRAGKGKRREFRIVMVSIALLYLFIVEQAYGQGAHHPPAFRRFEAAVQHFEAGRRSAGLQCAYIIFKTVLDPATPQPEGFDTPTRAFEWMAHRLRTIFPP